ncbi:MAG: hypothetical protein EXR71_15815 [Myxococcales bacterium]|nr:hypothetical protein [Myxococcales bacterium]
MLLPLLVALAPAFSGCAVPRTVAELDARLLAAETAWSEGPVAFAETTAGTAALLECVNTPLPVATVGRLLRLEGLSAFARRAMAERAAAFAGARQADPALTLDDAYAGEGHPLRALWDTPARAPHPARNPLFGVAGAAALAGGVLYGLAWVEHDRALAAGDLTTLDDAVQANHAYSAAAAGAGGVAVFALTGAVVVARW